MINDEWQTITTSNTGAPITIQFGQSLPKGVRADTLHLHRYDEETGTWVDAAATECTPNSSYDRSVPGQLTVNLCHFSEFALTGMMETGKPESEKEVFLPLLHSILQNQ